MSLEKYVQLHFPFTIKGYMQQRAILQDLFLRDVYSLYLQDCFGKSHNYKTFDRFEREDGMYFMKQYSDANKPVYPSIL